MGELVEAVPHNDEMYLLLLIDLEVFDHFPVRTVDHQLERGQLPSDDLGWIGLNHQLGDALLLVVSRMGVITWMLLGVVSIVL
jgi:hypothetical protein